MIVRLRHARNDAADIWFVDDRAWKITAAGALGFNWFGFDPGAGFKAVGNCFTQVHR